MREFITESRGGETETLVVVPEPAATVGTASFTQLAFSFQISSQRGAYSNSAGTSPRTYVKKQICAAQGAGAGETLESAVTCLPDPLSGKENLFPQLLETALSSFRGVFPRGEPASSRAMPPPGGIPHAVIYHRGTIKAHSAHSLPVRIMLKGYPGPELSVRALKLSLGPHHILTFPSANLGFVLSSAGLNPTSNS